jgi:dUTP pyrophosphatase
MDVYENKDSDYRREADMIVMNLSEYAFVIRDGERICWKIISKHKKALWINVRNFIKSERDARGFGHTGKI